MNNPICAYPSFGRCGKNKNFILIHEILSGLRIIKFLCASRFAIRSDKRELLPYLAQISVEFSLSLYAENWGLS